MAEKKRKRLTIEERAKIIERLELGETATSLADAYGVTISAISQIKRHKENIQEQKRILEECGSSTKRKRFTGIENTLREQSLYTWLCEQRETGDPVSGPTLIKKALSLNETLQGPSGFKASPGFLHRFKKRHGIGAVSTQDDKPAAETSTSDDFCQQFSQFCQGNNYDPDQVYSATTTGLYWKRLPKDISAIPGEQKTTGKRLPDDCAALMVCSNASGMHKMPLFVVGKSPRPPCFKQIRFLPVKYRDTKSGRMDNDLLMDWYKNVFIPSVKERHELREEKVILLLNSTPGHPEAEEFDAIDEICKVIFLPSNFASSVQPLSQGVIEKMKKHYRFKLLHFILTEDSHDNMKKLFGSVNMLYLCNSISSSWDEVTKESIKKGWDKVFPVNKALPETAEVRLSGVDMLDMIRSLPNCAKVPPKQADNWLNVDAGDSGWNTTSQRNNTNDATDEEVVVEKAAKSEELPNERDVLRGLNDVLAWYQTTWTCKTENVKFLEDLRSQLITSIVSKRNAAKESSKTSGTEESAEPVDDDEPEESDDDVNQVEEIRDANRVDNESQPHSEAEQSAPFAFVACDEDNAAD